MKIPRYPDGGKVPPYTSGQQIQHDDAETRYNRIAKTDWKDVSPEDQEWYYNTYNKHGATPDSSGTMVAHGALPMATVMGKKPWHFGDAPQGEMQKGFTTVANSVGRNAMQGMNMTGALSGEVARAIGGKGFNPRNILPEMIGGTGNQTNVSTEMGVENPALAMGIDMVTDPMSLFAQGKMIGNAFGKYTAKRAFRKEIYDSANDYMKDVTDHRNIERARLYDAEHGTNFQKRFEHLRDTQFSPTGELLNPDGKGPLNISLAKMESDIGGFANPNYPGKSLVPDKLLLKDLKKGKITLEDFAQKSYESFKDEMPTSPLGDIVLNEARVLPPKTVVPHEVSHQIDIGGKMYSPSAKKEMDDLFYGRVEDVHMPEHTNATKIEENNYIKQNTETKSFLGTNMRDELVKKGILKDRFDKLDEEKLIQVFNMEGGTFSRFYPHMNMDDGGQKFMNWFNKIPLATTGVIGGTAAIQSQQEPEYKNGGQVMRKQYGNGGVTGSFGVPAFGQEGMPNPYTPKQGMGNVVNPANGAEALNPNKSATGAASGWIQAGAALTTGLGQMLPKVYDTRIGMQRPNFARSMSDATYTTMGASIGGGWGALVGGIIDTGKNIGAYFNEKGKYNTAVNKFQNSNAQQQRLDTMGADYTGAAKYGMRVPTYQSSTFAKDAIGSIHYQNGGGVPRTDPPPTIDGGSFPEVTVRPDMSSQKLILDNLKLPMVQRMFMEQNDPNRPRDYFVPEYMDITKPLPTNNPTGLPMTPRSVDPSTHLMGWNEFGEKDNPEGYGVFPTLKNANGQMTPIDGYKDVKDETILMPASKYSAKQADKFASEGYKEAVNDLKPWLGGQGFPESSYQNGGGVPMYEGGGGVPVQLEDNEAVLMPQNDGSYQWLGKTASDAPSHEQGGVNMNLPEGALVFPGKYVKGIKEAHANNDWSAIKAMEGQMMQESKAAAQAGKPYSSGGLFDNGGVVELAKSIKEYDPIKDENRESAGKIFESIREDNQLSNDDRDMLVMGLTSRIKSDASGAKLLKEKYPDHYNYFVGQGTDLSTVPKDIPDQLTDEYHGTKEQMAMGNALYKSEVLGYGTKRDGKHYESDLVTAKEIPKFNAKEYYSYLNKTTPAKETTPTTTVAGTSKAPTSTMPGTSGNAPAATVTATVGSGDRTATRHAAMKSGVYLGADGTPLTYWDDKAGKRMFTSAAKKVDAAYTGEFNPTGLYTAQPKYTAPKATKTPANGTTSSNGKVGSTPARMGAMESWYEDHQHSDGEPNAFRQGIPKFSRHFERALVGMNEMVEGSPSKENKSWNDFSSMMRDEKLTAPNVTAPIRSTNERTGDVEIDIARKIVENGTTPSSLANSLKQGKITQRVFDYAMRFMQNSK